MLEREIVCPIALVFLLPITELQMVPVEVTYLDVGHGDVVDFQAT